MASTYFLILVLVTTIQSVIIKYMKPNVLTFTPKAINDEKKVRGPYSLFRSSRDLLDIRSAKDKAEVIKADREKGKDIDHGALANVIDNSDNKQHYRLDQLLNGIRRAEQFDYDDTSSSVELGKWKDEWKEHWLKKKFEALNTTRPKGDTVNMVAARPWGVPCGDPNQHDMPWGTCMLPMECDAEFRIFRGDYFCGRSAFVCCALQLTTYDMYQGFDVSFADSSLQTDSQEKKSRNTGSRERKKRKKYRDQQKRRRERLRRKRKMKRNIKRIVRQIKKILNRHFRNGTTERSRKTRQLKKFVKMMKERFKEERKVIKDLHEMHTVKADAEIQARLNQIKALNEEFMHNDTFRDIVINGTASKNADNVRTLMQNYPDLVSLFQTRRGGAKRPRDYLDYDIEYGFLYY